MQSDLLLHTERMHHASSLHGREYLTQLLNGPLPAGAKTGAAGCRLSNYPAQPTLAELQDTPLNFSRPILLRPNPYFTLSSFRFSSAQIPPLRYLAFNPLSRYVLHLYDIIYRGRNRPKYTTTASFYVGMVASFIFLRG